MKDRSLVATSLLAVTFQAILVVTASLAASASDKVLYSFQGGDDGANPEAPLIADRLGNLYGTTDSGGGACNCGTVFVLSPPAKQGGAWVETVLYRFQGKEAATPAAGLIFDAAGNLYGTTVHGGASNDGTVFRLAPPSAPGESWTETTLYEFKGGQDGEYPVASLVFDTSGNLYGTTLFGGGPPQLGIVFQLVPPAEPGSAWQENVLHQFGRVRGDGADPQGALLVDKHGAVYGTTLSGLVFKLSPPQPGQSKWREHLVYEFNGPDDGGEPGYILAAQGVVYGAATLGGNVNHGTVFQLTPQAGTWKETTLYNFQGGADGGLPVGQVLRDRSGNLYGTTYAGQQPDNGTVFRLSPSKSGTWSKTILHEFGGNGDGATPNGGLIKGKGGALYGTTNKGGAFGVGAVYAIAP